MFDVPVKSQKLRYSVIPANAGIQCSRMITERLETGFHRCGDFLHVHLLLVRSGFRVKPEVEKTAFCQKGF
jgi:hypothetical protein